MFTLKHIAPCGTEFAIQCKSYLAEAVTDAPGDLRLMTYDENHISGSQTGLWYGRRCHRHPGAHQIHIMNQHGATIASHYFEDRDDSPTAIAA